MKYRLTPLNIACGLAIGLAIYLAVRPGLEGWGFLMTIYLIPLILITFITDFIIQKFLPSSLFTFTTEVLLLGVIFFCYCWTQRTKTLIIPDNLQSQYVVTIYGVENSAKLPSGWNYEVKVPINGLLLTSSTFNSDLHKTKMQTYSGIKLNSDETVLGWARITNNKFDCNGKTYAYQIWMVSNSCCGYSNRQIDSLKTALKEKFCRQ
jgi:hypothetical protein